MPLQNRVSPFGDLIAVPERGLVYGNRGCLHDSYGKIRRHHDGRRWIACRLSFRGRHRVPLLRPGGYTELFFLDEATALAAGHRPCALCRRADYDRFVQLWSVRHPGETAPMRSTGGCTPSGCSRTGVASGGTRSEHATCRMGRSSSSRASRGCYAATTYCDGPRAAISTVLPALRTATSR